MDGQSCHANAVLASDQHSHLVIATKLYGILDHIVAETEFTKCRS